MGTLRIKFVDNSTMDSVALKLKRYLEGRLPASLLDQLYITSARRGSSGADYHEDMGSNGALDIAAAMDDAGQRAMQAAARIIIQDAPLFLEQIHTTPFPDDSGFYVKNGQVIGGYDPETNSAHLNHIHLAADESMGDQLMAKYPAGIGPDVPEVPPVQPAATDGTFPLPLGHVFGNLSGPANWHGGVNASEKAYVLAIQKKLQQLGHAPNIAGWADGIYEDATAHAVRDMQRFSALTVDGLVGPATWAKLFGVPDSTGKPDPHGDGVFLWDASNHDWSRGPMDVSAAKADGIMALVHKVGGAGPTEGVPYSDQNFGEAMRRGEAAGMPILGSYFVVCPTGYVSARQQVDWWVGLLDQGHPGWRSRPTIHQIDAEKWGRPDYPASAEDIKAIVAEWRSRNLPGYLVGYLPDEYYGDAPDLGVDLWLPDYHSSGTGYRELYPGDSDPVWSSTSAGRHPEIWQYASDATIGSQPMCDANRFRGSLDELVRRASYGLPTGPSEPPSNPIPPPPVLTVEESLALILKRLSDLESKVHNLPGWQDLR